MDEAAKRREARRRKILENSGNRMKRITGVEQKSTANDDSSTGLNSEDSHNHIPFELLSENQFSNETNISNDTNVPRNHLTSSELNGGLVSNLQRNPIRHIQSFEWSKNRIHIIISLAIVVNSIQCLGFSNDPFSYSYLNNIFIPLILFRMVDMFMYNKRPNENKNFIYLLLLLNLQQNHAVRTATKFLEVFTNFIQDLLIYFFAFSCAHMVKGILWPS